MHHVNKSMLVPYSPDQMFALIDDIERYPEFLPWCAATTVQVREEQVTRATLAIDFRGVRQQFTTENRKQRPRRMDLKLVSGPFRDLHGNWRFTDLGGKGCKVEFELHYDFSSRMLAAMMGPVFGHVAGTLVDAFVKRAEAIHGARH